jgi:beta-aspartyl-peptidase (threonine type)
MEVIKAGGDTLDAVVAGVNIVELDPRDTSVGYGGLPNEDGVVELDCSCMHGPTRRGGAVGALRNIKTPSKIAQLVLTETDHMMLVGEGAERFAVEHGIALCDPDELISEAEQQAWLKCRNDKHAAEHHRGHEQGTVGTVALDKDGNLFAATSTGGTCCKLPGRVGDSPLIGCGCYADSEAGGVSCTGYGEAIMKIVMAKSAVEFLRQSPVCADSPAGISCDALTANVAAREAVHLLAKRTRGQGGLILLDRHGNPGFAFNTPRMAYGYVAMDGNFVTAV